MGLLVDKDGKPLPDDQQPTIAGWAKHAVFGGTPQAGPVPLSEVPGIIAAAPGAYLSATGDAIARDTGMSKPAADSASVSGIPDRLDPGEPGDQSEMYSDDSRIAKDLNFERPFASPQAKAFFEKEGYSKAPVGGAELYDEAFVHAPERRRQAQTDLAALQGQHSQQLADFYKQQTEQDVQAAAATKQKAAEDAENVALRQKRLDEATQFYTNDLADQGKFWTNPGNIVSAIAFSLMPIFSNDPAIGAKLINQAIDRDMANRQQAASTTLGALSSNLAGYHKIAGDRQAGDLLARAEAHRIAAQEIARIGQNFAGPISQKQMQIAIEDQNTRMAAAQMEFYKANVHVNPSKMDPALHGARVLGGDSGYNPGVAPLGGVLPTASPDGPAQGTAVTGSIGGTPSTAGAKLSPTTQALVNTGGVLGIEKGQRQGFIKGNEIEEAVRSALYRKAIAEGVEPNKYFDKKVAEAREELKPLSPEIAKNAGARSMITSLQGKMAIIDKLERADGKDPNGFVSWGRKNLPGELVRQYDQLFGKDPKMAANKAEEFAAWKANSVRTLEQQMAGVINMHIHELSGGNVSSNEKTRMDSEIAPNTPWRQQVTFLENKSKQLQAFIDANKTGLSPVAMVLYRHASNGGKFNGLYRPGQPGPAVAPVAPSEGQVSGGRSQLPPGASVFGQSQPGMPEGPIQ